MARTPTRFRSAAPLPAALVPLREKPATAAVFVDFDGTLAPIVADPDEARPLPGAPDLLSRLARTFGLVAVVSGRTGAFLASALPPMARVRVVGAYGIEEVGPDGTVVTDPRVATWRPAVAGAAERAEDQAPPGVLVEPKGTSVTLHWRTRPDRAGWVEAFVTAEAARSGLVAHHGRMSIELRPPLPVDKGAVVENLGRGFGAVAYLGDDLADLPAFAALERLAHSEGTAVARVCVVDAQTPPELLARADVTVTGPEEVLALLAGLLSGG